METITKPVVVSIGIWSDSKVPVIKRVSKILLQVIALGTDVGFLVTPAEFGEGLRREWDTQRHDAIITVLDKSTPVVLDFIKLFIPAP